MYVNGKLYEAYAVSVSGINNLQSIKQNIYTKNNKAQKQIIMLQIKEVQKCW